MHHETPMLWTHRLEGLGQESQKQKISSQEDQDTSNAWEVAEKEGTPEDPSKRTDKGKSSHAFSAGNLVTLQEIADRNIMAIKGPNAQTKGPHKTICQ
jgi:hypothetical protein